MFELMPFGYRRVSAYNPFRDFEEMSRSFWDDSNVSAFRTDITEKDGKYIIRVVTVADGKTDSIQHGQGHAPKAFNVVLPGVINENIPGVAQGIVGLSTVNYPSSTCTITVDPATGRVINADYDLKWTINFDKVGAIIPFTTHDYYTITY